MKCSKFDLLGENVAIDTLQNYYHLARRFER